MKGYEPQFNVFKTDIEYLFRRKFKIAASWEDERSVSEEEHAERLRFRRELDEG